MKSVYVVGPDSAIQGMFTARGWAISKHSDIADLICFTGGADVSPFLYGETNHRSHNNEERDREEIRILRERPFGKAAVGICRGAQFLNVMAGGRMWQHVNNHTGPHDARDLTSDKIVLVTSTHHQMMRQTNLGIVLMIAQEAACKESAYERITVSAFDPSEAYDTECVYYPRFNYLCYQPHPEYVAADHECQHVFFKYIDSYLFPYE
jgi:gamma-glutamyl-gamma-aminobutyrate hydrolase PuuD